VAQPGRYTAAIAAITNGIEMVSAAHNALSQFVGMSFPQYLFGLLFRNRTELINAGCIYFLRTVPEDYFTHDGILAIVKLLTATARSQRNIVSDIDDLFSFGQRQVIPAVTQTSIAVGSPAYQMPEDRDFSQLRK
jgi:hypothetical protein